MVEDLPSKQSAVAGGGGSGGRRHQEERGQRTKGRTVGEKDIDLEKDPGQRESGREGRGEGREREEEDEEEEVRERRDTETRRKGGVYTQTDRHREIKR